MSTKVALVDERSMSGIGGISFHAGDNDYYSVYASRGTGREKFIEHPIGFGEMLKNVTDDESIEIPRRYRREWQAALGRNFQENVESSSLTVFDRDRINLNSYRACRKTFQKLPDATSVIDSSPTTEARGMSQVGTSNEATQPGPIGLVVRIALIKGSFGRVRVRR